MESPGLKFLFWCANEHLDFRIPEFEALAELFQIQLCWVERNSRKPWIILELKSEEEALKLISRSISTKYCIQLWADGQSYEEFHHNLKSFPLDIMEPFCSPEKSFKIYAEAFMKKLTLEERLERINSFSYLPFKGPVKMKEPDVVFSNFEFFGFDHNNLPETPYRIFFGRCIGQGKRDIITKHSIKTRKFIGNTTMDPQLALLMSNMALVKNGDLILDPFVGTGSLLLAAAQFGGLVIGSDIDFLMLHARTRPSRKGQKRRCKDESIKANFEQYQLESNYLDVVVADFSKTLWNSKIFNAIITDPPYGIREPTAKVGTTKENVVIEEKHLACHVPQKIEYEMSDMYQDILKFGAENLQESGRLVFWVPIVREDYAEDKLPKHPKLKLVANCEQILSSHTSRRLLVMEKILESEDSHGCEDGGEMTSVTLTTSEFRQHFYKSTQNIPRKERKERLKKYGHLNSKQNVL